MADAETSGATTTSRELLREAEEHYADALEQMHLMKMCFRDRTDLTEAEIKRVAGEYRRATQTLFDERKRVEELDKRSVSTITSHNQAIDFDAIRGEIGGLLDRLRTVRGPV